MTAMRKRPEVKEPGNRQGTMKDPTDHIREVPIGAAIKVGNDAARKTLYVLILLS
jgi:hypothetical protein